MNLRKPTREGVGDPTTLLVLLQGLRDTLAPSGVLLPNPTTRTATDAEELLVCLVRFYGAAYILGATSIPRPDSRVIGDVDRLTVWLVRLFDAVAPS